MVRLEDEVGVNTRKEDLVVLGSLHHVTVFSIVRCILSRTAVEWPVRGYGL